MPNLPSTNLSFDLINDELGNNSTDTLDLKSASEQMGESAAPYGMDELVGLSGAGTRPNFTTDLTAVNTSISGEGKIQLNWVVDLDPTGTQGGESFALKRSTNSNMSSATTISTNNDNSELETGLTAGVLYYFQATGTNDAGSTNSSIVNARATELPSITSFTVASGTGGLGLIDINWSVDNGNPNSLTAFKVEQSANSDMSSATNATTTNDGSHQYNVSANAGATVYFRITATNSVGTTVSSIKSAVASSKPTINSFTGARSETVAQAIDLNWSTTAGTAATSAFSITRGTTLANAIGGTSVTTTDDSTEQVGSLGFGQSYFFYMTITNANGTSVLYANSNSAITTRPQPTIDTFTAVGGSSGGEIDITYATTEADTVTLKEDNTNDGTFETTILNNSSTVDGSLTRTGLTATNLHNYQLTATGVSSVVATDDAFPTAPTSWTNSNADIVMSGTNGKFASQDSITTGNLNLSVTNPSGNTSVSVSQTGIDGESLKISWSANATSGYSTYETAHTNIPASTTTIYYRVKWTENFGIGHIPSDEDNPISVDRNNQITWTNNSVTEQQGFELNFYNSV